MGNKVLEVLQTKTDDSNNDWHDNDGDSEENPAVINWFNQQKKEEVRSDCYSELNKRKPGDPYVLLYRDVPSSFSVSLDLCIQLFSV